MVRFFIRITKQTLALLAGLRTASNSSCRRSCPILTIHLRFRLLVKLRESGGSRFDRNPPNMVKCYKRWDWEDVMLYHQKAPFLACYVLNLMDLYNFSGQLDFALLLVFQGIASPQDAFEISHWWSIQVQSDHIPYGGLASGKILQYSSLRWCQRILVWLLSNMSIDSFFWWKRYTLENKHVP